jgi:NAD(P)-dependent dehydrogenase (short-subunit alcohol dehydrogenase family)
MDSKVWLITGCSSGFGLELARAVIAAGHRLMATARNTESIAHLKAEGVEIGALDVTNPLACRDAVEDTVAYFGRLDVLANNAGQGLTGALEELSREDIERNLAVNYLGPLDLMRAALPVMRVQRSGHIVNIGAMAAVTGEMGFGAYGAAKAALELASEALASEVSPFGIKVTVVTPGPFRTRFIQALARGGNRIADYDRTAGKFAAYLDKIDGQQPGDPAKAAQAILEAVAADRPPRRLLIGKFAHDKTRQKLQNWAKEIDAWEAVGLPTDV